MLISLCCYQTPVAATQNGETVDPYHDSIYDRACAGLFDAQLVSDQLARHALSGASHMSMESLKVNIPFIVDHPAFVKLCVSRLKGKGPDFIGIVGSEFDQLSSTRKSQIMKSVTACKGFVEVGKTYDSRIIAYAACIYAVANKNQLKRFLTTSQAASTEDAFTEPQAAHATDDSNSNVKFASCIFFSSPCILCFTFILSIQFFQFNIFGNVYELSTQIRFLLSRTQRMNQLLQY